ncbi:Aspyridones efflux protein-like protein 4 [Elsinoe fawcettii]|nr:Aspyridones efflux protein-like protein 4 [Elsinoe fawcettii]
MSGNGRASFSIDPSERKERKDMSDQRAQGLRTISELSISTTASPVSRLEEGAYASNATRQTKKTLKHRGDHLIMACLEARRGRWTQVLAGSLVFMNNWGLASSFGVFQAYYLSPIASPSLSAQGYKPFDIAWIGTTQASLTLIVGILSGPLFDKGYFYLIIGPASLLFSVSFMLLSVSTKYWHILLLQGILQGICSGMLYIPSISMIRRHFASSRRGTALGLVTAGASIGGMVYPIVFRFLIEQKGFAWSTRIMGFIVLGTLGIACSLMKPAARSEDRARKGDDRSALLSMMKDPPYLTFLAAAFLLFCGMLVPYVFCATYSVTVVDGVPGDLFYAGPRADTSDPTRSSSNDDLAQVRDRAFYTVVILNAANFFGRVIPAMLSDKDRVKPEIMLGISTVMMGILGFCWIPIKTREPYIAFLVLYGLSSGTLSTLPPIALPHLCPNVDIFATSLGIVYLCAGLGVLVGTPVAALLDNQSPSSYPYLASQIWTGGCMLLGTVFVTHSGYHIYRNRNEILVTKGTIRMIPIESPPPSIVTVA